MHALVVARPVAEADAVLKDRHRKAVTGSVQGGGTDRHIGERAAEVQLGDEVAAQQG